MLPLGAEERPQSAPGRVGQDVRARWLPSNRDNRAAATMTCDEGIRRRLKKPPSHYNIAPASPQSACILAYPLQRGMGEVGRQGGSSDNRRRGCAADAFSQRHTETETTPQPRSAKGEASRARLTPDEPGGRKCAAAQSAGGSARKILLSVGASRLSARKTANATNKMIRIYSTRLCPR